MWGFVLTKHNLWGGLHFCFHLKNSVTESFHLLPETYGKHASSIASCEYPII